MTLLNVKLNHLYGVQATSCTLAFHHKETLNKLNLRNDNWPVPLKNTKVDEKGKLKELLSSSDKTAEWHI